MTENYTRYCKKCDKWLDNQNDYKEVIGKCIGCQKSVYEGIDTICSSPACKNKSCEKCSTTHCYCNGVYSYTPGDSTSSTIECSTCGTQSEQESMFVIQWCQYCGKQGTDKSEWDKHKSNWQKRVVAFHEEKPGRVEKDSIWGNKEYNKITINHDCQVKCQNCNQKKKLEKFLKDGELIKNFSCAFQDAYCQTCRGEQEKKDKEERDREKWAEENYIPTDEEIKFWEAILAEMKKEIVAGRASEEDKNEARSLEQALEVAKKKKKNQRKGKWAEWQKQNQLCFVNRVNNHWAVNYCSNRLNHA